ncbi:MAG: hypothetical protein P1R58_10180 [bacterium]|nr:hypothetical protein [bacterium]
MTLFFVWLLAVSTASGADGKLLIGQRKVREVKGGETKVVHQCLTPPASERISLPLDRDKPWSLPNKALAADYTRNIHILVLRYNFQLEQTDNPNTTGLGHMDLSDDSAAFFNENGHFIDPPPHDSAYFSAHMKALSLYYDKVSEGKLTLTWEIYPKVRDSVYELPQEMGAYGACSDTLPESEALPAIVHGLEQYFIDCLRLADTVSPEIVFSDYESIFLFHAGADQQNNIGFPPTCSDMFTGFIRFGDSIQADDGTIFIGGVPVDNDSTHVKTALMMPETASQDNRATALNAVIAHEFGHQLGLVDLYRTGAFRTQLGDFALMDNNGFGTGIEFGGFTVGSTFGINPVFPCAWSRAYLGFVDVVEYRRGTDIRLVAAEVESEGIKVARVPISDDEYYLIENRLQETDNKTTFMIADSVTSVIWGPGDSTKTLTGEYDHLMGGSGVIIYHIDESVAREDWGANFGVNNFYDNQLQLDPERRFIRLVEADGIVDFGGYYNAGYGSDEDLYRDDRNDKFTPNSNPPSIDNTGNNSHVHITNITRDSVLVGYSHEKVDSVVFFDVRTDGLVENFPVRVGYPIPSYFDYPIIVGADTAWTRVGGVSVIADDLDRDGVDEIIVGSNAIVSAFNTDGSPFVLKHSSCGPCATYVDNSHSRFDGADINIVDSVLYGRDTAAIVPAYFVTPHFITAGPVTGDFEETANFKIVAVGYPATIDSGEVSIHLSVDLDGDALADEYLSFKTFGWPKQLLFDDILYAVTDRGMIYRKSAWDTLPPEVNDVAVDSVYGACRIGDGLALLGQRDESAYLMILEGNDTLSWKLPEVFDLNPVIADLDSDQRPEVICASQAGDLAAFTVDTTGSGSPLFSIYDSKQTGHEFITDPVIGDIDLDGHPDIVLGGFGKLYAFDDRLLGKLDYPRLIDDRFPEDAVLAPPIICELDGRNKPELIFPSFEGNLYSLSHEETYGFPLSAGERTYSSPLVMTDTTGAKLGYVGDDGWFYLWDFWANDFDQQKAFWPMVGADPGGKFVFDNSKLKESGAANALLVKDRFFVWPNPVIDGAANIRYYLGRRADQVTISIYDLSGVLISEINGAVMERENEYRWDCSAVTPGVYRCLLEVEAAGKEEHAFFDIAVIR